VSVSLLFPDSTTSGLNGFVPFGTLRKEQPNRTRKAANYFLSVEEPMKKESPKEKIREKKKKREAVLIIASC